MDWPPEFNSGKQPSPKRELQLQGPRPTPLKVRKDSHKIKKPPIAPQHHHQLLQDHQQHQQQQQAHQQQQQRQPVIIYTVSPKVIHTNASEFMSLVQRLTGSSTDTSTSTATTTTTLASPSNGAISPAARFATIEKTKTPSEAEKTRYYHNNADMMLVDELFDDAAGPTVERTGSFPGILSPVPSSLPIVPPDFFSPPSDHNPFNFTHDLSPLFQGNKNYFDGLGSFGASPGSTFLSAPPITSPTLTFDLFNQFLDF